MDLSGVMENQRIDGGIHSVQLRQLLSLLSRRLQP